MVASSPSWDIRDLGWEVSNPPFVGSIVISSYCGDGFLVPAADMRCTLPYPTVLQCIIGRVILPSCRFDSFGAAVIEFGTGGKGTSGASREKTWRLGIAD